MDTDDIPGIARAKGNELAQAGAVCLQLQRHPQGVGLAVRGYVRKSLSLVWRPASDQAMRTWNDYEEATEDGAAGIAALLAFQEIGYHVILRSKKTTGFDYWLGDRDQSNVSEAERTATAALQQALRDKDLVVRARMEVSGIRVGNNSMVRARVRRKVNQTKRSQSSGLPAYVIVVEFGSPLAEVRST